PARTKEKENAVRPKLQISFSTFTVKNGENLKVEIPVTGNPAPKIEWKRDAQVVKETSRLEILTKGDNTWISCSESRAPELLIEGLKKGNEYFFRVSAINEKGKSEPKTLLAPVILKDNSASPVILLLSNTFNVKAGNDLGIDVPFRGLPQPTVVWKKDGNILKETSRVNVQTSDSTSQIKIKDASRTDVGVYEVTLTNSVGTTSAEIFVNVFERPGPPTALILDELSADFVSLSWQPPLYSGGCQISNYVVEKHDTSSTVWQTVSATVARTSIKISRLTQGTEYQFRVAAENRYGRSQFVETQTVVAQYPFKPPCPPINLHIELASKSAIVIAWNKPDNAEVVGSPNPTVFWLKNGRNICTTGRVEITTTKTNTSLLVRECVRKDSGQYTLTLQNTGGTISKVVTCKVLDRPVDSDRKTYFFKHLIKDLDTGFILYGIFATFTFNWFVKH
uniref:Titin n=1 Tax=Oryzias latipes TaxID=8090 RepID=A0A3P9LES8_ORYLA